MYKTNVTYIILLCNFALSHCNLYRNLCENILIYFMYKKKTHIQKKKNQYFLERLIEFYKNCESENK